MDRDKTPEAPPKKTDERRKDLFTRAIITGLQEMTAEIDRLPDSSAKVAALSAVARYARSIATAIEHKKREDEGRVKPKPTAFSGATLARESGKVLHS